MCCRRCFAIAIAVAWWTGGSAIEAPAGNAGVGEGRGISRIEDATMPPGPPGVVEVAHRGAVHHVEWAGTRDDTIRGYQVLRRCDDASWAPVAFVPLHADDSRNRGRYHYEDRNDGSCDYTVAAVSAANEPGPTSDEVR